MEAPENYPTAYPPPPLPKNNVLSLSFAQLSLYVSTDRP